jgi:hypothetical protein
MKRFTLILFLTVLSVYAYCQNGNFRSLASGTWSVPSTWERDSDNDGIYEDSPSDFAPSFLDGTIIIQSPHVVRVYSNVSVDQTTVNAGGRIAVNTGVTLTVMNGTGVDLLNAGTISTSAADQLVISSAAEFEYAKNGGTLPLATFDDSSTMTITGVTTAAPANLSQPGGFSHFVWNCNQSTTVYLNGLLTWVRGDLSITNTNNQVLAFANASSPTPHVISGNFNVTGNSRFYLTLTSAITVNLAGNFNFNSSSGSFSSLVVSTGSANFNIGGNTTVNSSGTLDLSGGSGIGTMNLSGNFVMSSGVLTETGTAVGAINFVKSGLQTFSHTGGSITNQIDYTVASGSTLQTLNESALIGRSLVLNGAINVGSLNSTGAIVSSTTVGSIRTSIRTYNSGSRIIYGGAGAQTVGNGHPLSTGVTMEIANANGVTFNTLAFGNLNSSTLQVAGDLVLTSGNFSVVSTSTTRALTLSGGLSATSGTISFSGASTNLTVNGTGTFGTFPSQASTIKNLTINRSGGIVGFSGALSVTGATTVSAGTLLFGGTTTLSGAVSQANSTMISFEGASLTINNSYTSSGGTLYSDGTSSLTISGGVVNPSALSFTAPGNVLGTLVLNKTHSGIAATINTALTITQALTLTDGQLENTGSSITVSSGATVSKSSIASISGSNLAGGPYNLIYTGGSSTSGFEIPADGNLLSLTLNTSSGATITLSQNIQVSNSITVTGSNRNLNCGTVSISAGSLNNGGTISAPSNLSEFGFDVAGDVINSGTFNLGNGSLSVGGDLNNTGTFDAGVGTVEFSGISSILGNAITFHHILITGELTAPASLSLRGNFVTNGPFDGNNGTVNFIGTITQTVTGGTPGEFYNINISNTYSPVSVTVNSDQHLNGILTLAANTTLDADGINDDAEFILRSTATGDAGIATIPTGASVLGGVTVERYLAARDDDYRFISSPISDGAVSQIQDNFPVTGTFTGTDNGCTGCEDGPSLRFYHEPVKGEFTLGYAATPETGGTNAEVLVPGRGYSSFMWNGGSNITLDLRGTINQGAFTFPYVSHTASDPVEPDADGWNLLGNPYPSAIQWNSTGWTRSSNVDPTVWVWDVIQGVWRSCNHTNPGSASLAGCRIASGQAFWVYVSPGAASISINETVKASVSGTYYRLAQPERPGGLFVTLRGNGAEDYASIIVDENGTENFDFGLDTRKLELGIETISLSVLGAINEKLESQFINADKLVGSDIPVNVGMINSGNFELSFDVTDKENFDGYLLHDRFLNHTVSLDKAYKFTVTQNALSKGARFVLTRNAKAGIIARENLVSYYPNPVSERLNVELSGTETATVILHNSIGQKVKMVELTSDGITRKGEVNVSSLPAGLYFLMVTFENKERHSYKIFKK